MRKTAPVRQSQPTSKELTDSCLSLIRTKFYQGDDRSFAKDRQRLLAWVVLFPASRLNKMGVTLHGDQYREIFVKVFIQAAAHVTSKVKYRPAYLRQVIQSHFDIHGEEYYEAAKSVRNLVEQTVLLARQSQPAALDPVKELANARSILYAGQVKKTAIKAVVKEQLSLF